MTLYEMLDITLYYQEVWIYVMNAYGQNYPVFKGTVHDARGDSEETWNYLMCKVDHYECNTGILIIKVCDEHYEECLETQYLNSDKWGREREKRPWLYSVEIEEDLRKFLSARGRVNE